MQHPAGKCTPVAGRTQPIFRVGLIPHATWNLHQTVPQQKHTSHQTCTVINTLQPEREANPGCLPCNVMVKSLMCTTACMAGSKAANEQEIVTCLCDSCCTFVFHLPYVLERVSANGDTFDSVRRPDIRRTSRPAPFAS